MSAVASMRSPTVVQAAPTSLRQRPPTMTCSGHRHAKVSVTVQRGANTTSTGGATAANFYMYGSTIRYRTDLDKPVIHFMLERLGRPVEELVIAGSHGEEPDRENTAAGEWHFFWMSVSRIRSVLSAGEFRLHSNQIINHFPNHYELTRKDLMYKNIRRYLREHAGTTSKANLLTLATATDWVTGVANVHDEGSSMSHGSAAAHSGRVLTAGSYPTQPSVPLQSGGCRVFNFADGVPITYSIPNDMGMFTEEFKRHPGATWIVKPTSRSQGKGIFLINKLSQLHKWIKEKKELECGLTLQSLLTATMGTTSSTTASATIAMPSAPGVTVSAPSEANGVGRPKEPQAAASTAAAHPHRREKVSPSGKHRSPLPEVAATPPAGSPVSSSTRGTPPPAPVLSAKEAKEAKEREKDLLGAFIVSRYVANPLLIGGKKFDLRLYVLVTSYKPLVAYLHEAGFARFCATKYAGESLAEDDLGSHLTNVALQKGDDNYNTTHGGKWSLRNLILYIQARHGPYLAEGLTSNIRFLVYHSLKAMEATMFNDKHSFELYGYDILVDDNIMPHLIEVNASPSLSTTTISDRVLKEEVLSDVLKIVLPPGFPSLKAMPYWEWRTRTDLTTQLPTGFKLLEF